MLYLYHAQGYSTLDVCLQAPAPHAGFVGKSEGTIKDGRPACSKSQAQNLGLENIWSQGALEEGETYVLQVTGYLDQQCWEDNERDPSAAGDYVLSVECADEPVDEWCADFDWCEDKELRRTEPNFATSGAILRTGPARQTLTVYINQAAPRTARLRPAANSPTTWHVMRVSATPA